MRTRWLVISCIVLATAAPRVFAQSASVQAQSLFEEGRKLLKAGKLAEACAAFDSSQKLDPAIATLLNLADCRERNQQLATAWGTFADANRMARASNNDKLARVASNHARKLEPRLSKLTISVPADRQVPDLEVLRNGETVLSASWNHALPIDGGSYTITARAPGRAPWSTTKTIKVESDVQIIEIPKLTEAKPGAPIAAGPAGKPGAPSVAKAGAEGVVTTPSSGGPGNAPAVPVSHSQAGSPGGTAPARITSSPGSSPGAEPPAPGARSVAEATPEPATPQVTTPASDQREAAPSRTVPLIVGAGALVLGGGALAFHLSGNSTYDKAKAATTQAQQDDLYHSANTRRYLAEGFGIAAVGCAGAAVYLYIRSRGEHRAETTAVAPIASPQLAGVAIVGSW